MSSSSYNNNARYTYFREQSFTFQNSVLSYFVINNFYDIGIVLIDSISIFALAEQKTIDKMATVPIFVGQCGNQVGYKVDQTKFLHDLAVNGRYFVLMLTMLLFTWQFQCLSDVMVTPAIWPIQLH